MNEGNIIIYDLNNKAVNFCYIIFLILLFFLFNAFFKQQQQQNKIRDLEEQILNSNQINIDSLNERDIKFEELSTRSVF